MPTPFESGSDAAYQAKLLGVLGTRDWLDVLAQTPDALHNLIRDVPQAVLQSRPSADRWSPTEIIGHLVDSEWLFGYRVRLVLCEERPTILGMDQNAWVIGQGYARRDPFELAAQFAALRRCNLPQWRQIAPADLARVGLHKERGEESLELMLRMEAGHDLSHLDQLARYITAALA